LLAAALLSKTQGLFLTLKKKLNLNWLFFGISFTGVLLTVAAFFTNFYRAIGYGKLDYLVFTVEGSVGYSFLNSAKNTGSSISDYLQILGFVIVLSGFAWTGKYKLMKVAKLFRR
jgi:hypothetical protein